MHVMRAKVVFCKQRQHYTLIQYPWGQMIIKPHAPPLNAALCGPCVISNLHYTQPLEPTYAAWTVTNIYTCINLPGMPVKSNYQQAKVDAQLEENTRMNYAKTLVCVQLLTFVSSCKNVFNTSSYTAGLSCGSF